MTPPLGASSSADRTTHTTMVMPLIVVLYYCTKVVLYYSSTVLLLQARSTATTFWSSWLGVTKNLALVQKLRVGSCLVFIICVGGISLFQNWFPNPENGLPLINIVLINMLDADVCKGENKWLHVALASAQFKSKGQKLEQITSSIAANMTFNSWKVLKAFKA